ncbi:MAG: hypothetical protein ACUVQ5_01655 [Candidatus Methanomethylicaceae archaeon]
MIDYNFKDLIKKKLLIKGGVGTGKTRLTDKLLHQCVELLPAEHVTVMDFAPTRRKVGVLMVGGSLSLLKGVRYLRPSKVWAPRLEGKTKEEVLELAHLNALSIEELFQIYKKSPTPILFINDLTLYLHAGSLERLLEVVSVAGTFVCNAYEGHQLSEDKGSGISDRERRLLKDFERYMDIVIDLNRK